MRTRTLAIIFDIGVFVLLVVLVVQAVDMKRSLRRIEREERKVVIQTRYPVGNPVSAVLNPLPAQLDTSGDLPIIRLSADDRAKATAIGQTISVPRFEPTIEEWEVALGMKVTLLGAMEADDGTLKFEVGVNAQGRPIPDLLPHSFMGVPVHVDDIPLVLPGTSVATGGRGAAILGHPVSASNMATGGSGAAVGGSGVLSPTH
jgi:hypothetical protein